MVHTTKDQYRRGYIDDEDIHLARFVLFLREVVWQFRRGLRMRFLYFSIELHSIPTKIIKPYDQACKKIILYFSSYKNLQTYVEEILTKQYKVLAAHQTAVRSSLRLVLFSVCPAIARCVSRTRWWLPLGKWAIEER